MVTGASSIIYEPAITLRLPRRRGGAAEHSTFRHRIGDRSWPLSIIGGHLSHQ